MSKIICDICGTKYPDTAEQCPICGYSNSFSAEETEFDESVFDEIMEETKSQSETKPAPKAESKPAPKAKAGLFGRKKAVEEDEDEDDEYEDEDDFDEDEYDEDDDDEYDDDDEDDEYDDDDEDEDDDDDDDDEGGSGVLLNVLLVIVILALLCVSGFIFVKYFLPSVMNARDAVATTAPYETEETTLPVEETEAPTVPCENLVLNANATELTEIGQKHLIPVVAEPADTTDAMIYVSADETVVVVDEEGCLTAVGNGTTVVTITCGDKSVDFIVSVEADEEESEKPDENAGEDETTGDDDATEAPETEETEAPEETGAPLKDVKLEIDGNTDVTFRGRGLEFTFKLKNGLQNNEVTWRSENESVCTIDEDGHMVITGKGRTDVVVTYGDQEVRVIVRATWE